MWIEDSYSFAAFNVLLDEVEQERRLACSARPNDMNMFETLLGGEAYHLSSSGMHVCAQAHPSDVERSLGCCFGSCDYASEYPRSN